MSEPLSKKLGISPIEEGTIVSGLMNGRECDAYIEGHNRAVRKLDQRSPDVNKLAEIIKNFDADYVKEANFLAEEIINKMNLWLVRRPNEKN